MLNGLEGIPGSGKSYEAVTFHVLHALKAGRLVITNLPLQKAKFAALDESYFNLIQLKTKASAVLGTWDADRVDEKGNGKAFQFFEDQNSHQLVEKTLTDNGVFGGVWDFYSEWKHPITGQGPLFVIDECHVCFPKIGINPEVVEWFKLHRHFNCDILIATQNFRDVNQPIANLLAMLVKVRNADILTGDRASYIRKVHAGYRGAAISTEVRKYDPSFFDLYKSHSQGNSVSESAASDVTPFLKKFQRFTRGFIAFTLCVCAFAVYRWFNRPEPLVAQIKPVVTSQQVVQSSLAPASAAIIPVPQTTAFVKTEPNVVPEPFATKGLHLSGVIKFGKKTVHMFALSTGATRIGSVSSTDLIKVGYTWEPLTDCIGVLRWKDTAKTITCDAPAVPEGGSSNPVVITIPAGSQTPTARSDGQQIANLQKLQLSFAVPNQDFTDKQSKGLGGHPPSSEAQQLQNNYQKK